VKRRSPPEKKALSYAKDRRNAYGENSKSSRKSIRQRKALVHRANRALARTALAGATIDPETAEGKLFRRHPKAWSKGADEPLASTVLRKLRRRRALGVDAEGATDRKTARVARHGRRKR
jgi:hypothetical protein